jgi:hypothetical protein
MGGLTVVSRRGRPKLNGRADRNAEISTQHFLMSSEFRRAQETRAGFQKKICARLQQAR